MTFRLWRGGSLSAVAESFARMMIEKCRADTVAELSLQIRWGHVYPGLIIPSPASNSTRRKRVAIQLRIKKTCTKNSPSQSSFFRLLAPRIEIPMMESRNAVFISLISIVLENTKILCLRSTQSRKAGRKNIYGTDGILSSWMIWTSLL